MSDLRHLRAAYDRALAYYEHAETDPHLSEFWREILAERRNYPTFDEMLVMRRGFTWPIADRAKVEDRAAEEAYGRAAWAVVGQTVPVEWFGRWAESALGAPVPWDFDGHALTAAGVVNALTSYRIVRALERAGIAGRPLRILEIGAGYGQVANQLLQVLDVATYAVCDLPENGFLGAFYLQGNHPARTAVFGEGGADSGLAFGVPPHLDRLDGPFDLIVNSYSFQEMSRESVDAYLAFAAHSLAPDGVLYSLNAHGKGKTGIEHPSDYLADGLELRWIEPARRYPWQVAATVPYEMVFGARAGAAAPVEERRRVDAIGRAMQLGLHDELEPLLGVPPEALASALDPEGPVGERHGAARELGPPIGPYVAGLLALAAGDDDAARAALGDAVASLPDTHARVRAHIALAALDASDRDAQIAAATALAPHLDGDIRQQGGDLEHLRALLASQLSLTPENDPPQERRRWRRGGR